MRCILASLFRWPISLYHYTSNYEPPKNREELEHSLKGAKPKKTAVKANQKMLDGIKKMAESFPNFEGVIQEITDSLQIYVHSVRPLRIAPLLMVGPPGIGKTEFSNQLCDQLNMDKLSLSGPEMSANFTLSGHDRSWGRSKPGLIAKQLINGEHINFMVYLDEIDKVMSRSNSGGILWPPCYRFWNSAPPPSSMTNTTTKTRSLTPATSRF